MAVKKYCLPTQDHSWCDYQGLRYRRPSLPCRQLLKREARDSCGMG